MPARLGASWGGPRSGAELLEQSYDTALALTGSETHAREANQRALTEIHAVAATVNRMAPLLREPDRLWTAAERSAVRRYADGWGRLCEAHDPLDPHHPRQPMPTVMTWHPGASPDHFDAAAGLAEGAFD